MRNNSFQGRGQDRGRSNWQDRANRRPPPSAAPRVQRSVRAINLGRISAEVERDVLACALEINETVLISLIEGRENASDPQYAGHMAHRLGEMGLSESWLDTPDIVLEPAQVKTIKEFAAKSVTRKSPTRRSNFKKLVQAFNTRLSLLSDALELVESSIRSIADGTLPFDEQRNNHINPRLMQAGFPNGWLETPDAELTEAMTDALVALATDEYERNFEEVGVPVVYVAEVIDDREASTASNNQNTEENAVKPNNEKEETMMEATNLENQAASDVQAVVVAPALEHTDKVTQDSELPVVNLSRGAMSAGRTFSNVSSIKTPAPATVSMPEFSAGEFSDSEFAAGGAEDMNQEHHPIENMAEVLTGAAAPVLVGMPPPSLAPVQTAALAPAPVQAETPVPTPEPVVQAGSPAPVNQAAQPVQAEAGNSAETAGDNDGGADDGKDARRTKSKERAMNLDRLMDTAVRGAKVFLWRDLMGRGLPYWGNVKRGAVLFQDSVVAEVEKALGLPEGWIDNPTYPPATLAAWVMDKDAKRPDVSTQNEQGSATQAAGEHAQPFKRDVQPAPSVELANALTSIAAFPTAAPVLKPEVAAAPVVAPRPAAPVPAPAPQQTAAPAPVAPQPVPSIPQSVGGIAVTRVANPVERATPGPIAQALAATLNDLSVKGKLSEKDALSLLCHLMETLG